MNAERILDEVAGRRDQIEAAVAFVHAHPELAHEERECSRFLAVQLADAGFDVELGIAGLDTAFRARREGAGGAAVGIVDLYDAVPAVRGDGSIEPVHSCGHGPIAGGVAGTALALAALGEELTRAVEVIGCPVDELHAPATRERGGGKALTAAAGVWEEFDAAPYAHPEFSDTVTLESRWMRWLVARLAGVRTIDAAVEASRAAAAKALAGAAGARSDSIMVETLYLDGDVEEGSGLALEATLFLMADSERELESLDQRIRAELPDVEWQAARTVPAIISDERPRGAVERAMRAAGRNYMANPPRLPFATDFSEISRFVPAALIGIGREGGWHFHTEEGAREFAPPDGVEAAHAIASVRALTAVDLLEAPV